MYNDKNTKDIINVACTIAGTALSIIVVYKLLSGPDSNKTTLMWTYDRIRTIAQKHEKQWHRIASEADAAYWNLTLV